HLNPRQQGRLQDHQHPPRNGSCPRVLDYEVTRPFKREKSPAPVPGFILFSKSALRKSSVVVSRALPRPKIGKAGRRLAQFTRSPLERSLAGTTPFERPASRELATAAETINGSPISIRLRRTRGS